MSIAYSERCETIRTHARLTCSMAAIVIIGNFTHSSPQKKNVSQTTTIHRSRNENHSKHTSYEMDKSVKTSKIANEMIISSWSVSFSVEIDI